VFDIHTYGRELISKLDELGGFDSPVPFSQAVTGHQPYEICRYFLAGLQLVCMDINDVFVLYSFRNTQSKLTYQLNQCINWNSFMFVDQELISSHCFCYCSSYSCWGDLFQKKLKAPSFQIGLDDI